MTGAGKTHTMFGTKQEAGIIQRSIEFLFNNNPNSNSSITCSFFEIYNENVRDLLSDY